MLDTIISGAQVVTPAGAGSWDVGIVGEKIVAVALPGVLPAEGAAIIDASGKIVLPGGIEPHAHAVANVQPGARQLVDGVPNAGPLEHSLGAIWGGTTTVIDFAPVPPTRETWRRGFTAFWLPGRATLIPTTRPTASTPATIPRTPSRVTKS